VSDRPRGSFVVAVVTESCCFRVKAADLLEFHEPGGSVCRLGGS
jgi:hypothetical protein